ncbi:MAG: hypothetical protein LBE21_03735 [Pseudomonadales bacterium]|nr:hypothetical protein [Pseudomonadales bacterium]
MQVVNTSQGKQTGRFGGWFWHGFSCRLAATLLLLPLCGALLAAEATPPRDQLTLLENDPAARETPSTAITRLERQVMLSEENLDRARIENRDLNERLTMLDGQLSLLRGVIDAENQRLAQTQTQTQPDPTPATPPERDLSSMLLLVRENQGLVAGAAGFVVLVFALLLVFKARRRRAAFNELALDVSDANDEFNDLPPMDSVLVRDKTDDLSPAFDTSMDELEDMPVRSMVRDAEFDDMPMEQAADEFGFGDLELVSDVETDDPPLEPIAVIIDDLPTEPVAIQAPVIVDADVVDDDITHDDAHEGIHGDIHGESTEQEQNSTANDDLDVNLDNLHFDDTMVVDDGVTSDSVAAEDIVPELNEIDLAAAYMAMGRREEALDLLEQVLMNGSVKQRREARRLRERWKHEV